MTEEERDRSTERSLLQTHEHWAPAVPAEDVPSFIYTYQAQGWEVAGISLVHDPDYRLVVLKRRLDTASSARWRCVGCHGTNVEVGMWVDPNARQVDPQRLEWIHDEPVYRMGLSATFWCHDCEHHGHGVEPIAAEGEGEADGA